MSNYITTDEQEREREFTSFYMTTAINCANMLSRERLKKRVGAVIVSPQGNIISYGFNGTPRGMPNECTYYDKDLNRERALPEVLHAESNAIAKASREGSNTLDCSLYVTRAPCLECSKLLIQSGIRIVYYIQDHKTMEGIELLRKCMINAVKLDPVTFNEVPDNDNDDVDDGSYSVVGRANY